MDASKKLKDDLMSADNFLRLVTYKGHNLVQFGLESHDKETPESGSSSDADMYGYDDDTEPQPGPLTKDDDGLCPSCGGRNDVAMFPCNHLCICMACWTKYDETDKCPLCNDKLKSWTQMKFK